MKMQTWKIIQGHDRLLFHLFPHLKIPSRFSKLFEMKASKLPTMSKFSPTHPRFRWRVQAIAWPKWRVSRCWIVAVFTREFLQDQTYFKSLENVQLLNTIIFHGMTLAGQRKGRQKNRCPRRMLCQNFTLLPRLQSCCFGKSLLTLFASLA